MRGEHVRGDPGQKRVGCRLEDGTGSRSTGIVDDDVDGASRRHFPTHRIGQTRVLGEVECHDLRLYPTLAFEVAPEALEAFGRAREQDQARSLRGELSRHRLPDPLTRAT